MYDGCRATFEICELFKDVLLSVQRLCDTLLCMEAQLGWKAKMIFEPQYFVFFGPAALLLRNWH